MDQFALKMLSKVVVIINLQSMVAMKAHESEFVRLHVIYGSEVSFKPVPVSFLAVRRPCTFELCVAHGGSSRSLVKMRAL